MEHITRIMEELRLTAWQATNCVRDAVNAQKAQAASLPPSSPSHEENVEPPAAPAPGAFVVPRQAPFRQEQTYARLAPDDVLDFNQTAITIPVTYGDEFYTDCEPSTIRLINLVLLDGLTEQVANTFIYVHGSTIWYCTENNCSPV